MRTHRRKLQIAVAIGRKPGYPGQPASEPNKTDARDHGQRGELQPCHAAANAAGYGVAPIAGSSGCHWPACFLPARIRFVGQPKSLTAVVRRSLIPAAAARRFSLRFDKRFRFSSEAKKSFPVRANTARNHGGGS